MKIHANRIGTTARVAASDGGGGDPSDWGAVLVRVARAAGISKPLLYISPQGTRPQPKARAAVRAWLWYMDGAIIDWLEHRDYTCQDLRELLLGTLTAAVGACER